MTDEAIIRGLHQNDRKTVEHVYKTMAPPLFSYVLSNNGTKSDAKDLFQETFMAVLIKIQKGLYKNENKFEAYFLRVARNNWIDQLRKNKGKQLIGDDDFLLERADESDESALIQLIMHDKRLEALNNTWTSWDDTVCWRTLNAFHFDNKSTKDIAHTEGVTQNAILQRIFKCRKKLFALVSKRL